MRTFGSEMSPKAQKLLEQLRALPAEERLRIVEQVMNDVEDAKPTADSSAEIALWADVDDAEFDAFSNAVRQLRKTDKLRIGDE